MRVSGSAGRAWGRWSGFASGPGFQNVSNDVSKVGVST